MLGNKAASTTLYPKPWVAVTDIVLALFLVFFVVRFLRRPRDPKRAQSMIDQMSKIASSPWIAIVAAGATLANPGGFVAIAMKDISETNPSTTKYIVEWVFFSVVSLLPLAVALIMLAVSPDRATRLLQRVRDWLLRNSRLIAAAITMVLGPSTGKCEAARTPPGTGPRCTRCPGRCA